MLSVGRISSGDSSRDYRSVEDLYKGYCEVLRALVQLRNKGVDAVLDVVGAGDALRDLQFYAETCGAGESVVFHGNLDDTALARRYAAADVFVLPSESEGFGFVYVEAMAHGLPCVAVRAGAAPEVVRDDESGFVVAARDTEALVDCLRVLAQNPLVRARLSEGATRRYETEYTREACLRRFVAALSGAALSRERSPSSEAERGR